MSDPSELKVAVEAGAFVTALAYPPDTTPVGASLILAHGAGAGQRSPFMVGFARALAARGLDVVTFNFLYTEQRRKLPDRRPALESCYRAVIAAVQHESASAREALFIGGKSMGGRIATHVAADPKLSLSGLVLLGYPLHPPGKPAERREAQLRDVACPMLVVQGSRDAFGTAEELRDAFTTLSRAPSLHVVDGGDHSFKTPRKTSGREGQRSTNGDVDVYADIQRVILEWIEATMRSRREARAGRSSTR